MWQWFSNFFDLRARKRVQRAPAIDKRIEQFRQLLRLALLPAEREHVDRRIKQLGDERAIARQSTVIRGGYQIRNLCYLTRRAALQGLPWFHHRQRRSARRRWLRDQ